MHPERGETRKNPGAFQIRKSTLLAIGFVFLVLSVTYASFIADEYELPVRTRKPIPVACVGDSITQWSGYPANLQSMLGISYLVDNFGVA